MHLINRVSLNVLQIGSTSSRYYQKKEDKSISKSRQLINLAIKKLSSLLGLSVNPLWSSLVKFHIYIKKLCIFSTMAKYSTENKYLNEDCFKVPSLLDDLINKLRRGGLKLHIYYLCYGVY